jgi:predicted permease
MRAESLYRALLYCYPAAFRQEYGGQMQLAFADQIAEARRTGSLLPRAVLWARAACDVLSIAPQEHCHVISQDLRYALRTMAAKPGFTAIAILSLALGIGANTAIFSLWNGVLHAPLPLVRDPGQLAMLTNPATAGMWHGRATGVRDWLTYPEFEQLRDHAANFSSMMASESFLDTWTARFPDSATEEVRGRLVSGGYFATLGVSPLRGRLFTAADDRGAAPYAVISYAFWQRRFDGRADILGKSFTLLSAVLTVVGITPSGFLGETVGQQPDLWIPLTMQPAVRPGEDLLHDAPPAKAMWLHVFGRLKPGVAPARAEAEANAVFQSGIESFYGAVASPDRRREYLDQRLKIRPGARGASETRSSFSTSLTVLMAAVGLLLLIACANLANLLLARGATRRSEIALRVSLGASRGRLVRQLLTESVLLAFIGGLTGFAVAYLLQVALARMIAESDRDFQMAFSLDLPLLAFTLAVTLGAALLFGLLPAWQVTRADASAALKEQVRGGSLGRMRWGRSLVSLQLALSLPLLVGAGLLVRTLFNLQHADLGFRADHLLLARVNFRQADYDNPRREALLRELSGELQRIPGVSAVSYSQTGLFTGGESTSTIEVEGYTPKPGEDRDSSTDVIGPGYFSTLAMRIAAGREILDSDRAATPRVCVVNTAFARRYFDRRNPIGMHVTSLGDERSVTYQVVGVAQDSRTDDLRSDVKPRFFVPATTPPSPTFLIRTTLPSAPLMTAVRRTIQRVDAALPVTSAASIEEQMAPLTAQDRATAQLAVAFGSVALLLAAIGLYGTLSYAIARRTGEIAVRIALGARPARVIAMILRETLALLAAGLISGAALAYAASRWVASRLYGVTPQDPLTLSLAIGLLLLVALCAAYLPARRASRLDPMAALRE